MDGAARLTVHFGDRDRAGGRFTADALLDLFERHGVRHGVLLRGIAGFGLRNHLRTDVGLTLSEDLPMVATAVDAPARIADLVDPATTLMNGGLVTVERAAATTGVPDPATLHEPAKLTVHLGRRDRRDGVPAHVAVCAVLRRHGVDGATAVLGVDGVVDGLRRRARLVGRNADVPVLVIAVGRRAELGAALPDLGRLVPQAQTTVERVTVCRRDGADIAPPPADPVTAAGEPADWQRLTVYGGDAEALVRGLRAAGLRGATAVRGIWGYHGDHEPHGDRLLQGRRGAPAVTEVVDHPPAIARAFAAVAPLTKRGLVTSDVVPRVLDG